MLVPNVDDMDKLGYRIRLMFYITAGVTTVLFILMVVGKTYGQSERGWMVCPLTVVPQKVRRPVSTPAALFFFAVFEDKPPTPPTQAQAKHVLSEGSSYTASLLRLLRNTPFMLLVLSYGGFLPVAFNRSSSRTVNGNASPRRFFCRQLLIIM